MKDRLANAFSRCNVCGAAVAAARCRRAARAPIDPVVQADRTRVQALEKGNGPAARNCSTLSWIDSEGIMWAREEAFRAGLKWLVASADDVKIIEHKYCKVAWTQENRGDKYVAHFWVQRPQGWRLLHTNDR